MALRCDLALWLVRAKASLDQRLALILGVSGFVYGLFFDAPPGRDRELWRASPPTILTTSNHPMLDNREIFYLDF